MGVAPPTTCSLCFAGGNQSLPPTNQSFIDPSTSAAAPNAADSNSTAAAEPITGIPLSVPFQLRSADGLQTPFTNYVRGYSGLLDYIWFEPSRLKVERAIPLPSLEEVQGYLPSQGFPSDHLSVRAPLLLKTTRNDVAVRHTKESCAETLASIWLPLCQYKRGGEGLGWGVASKVCCHVPTQLRYPCNLTELPCW